MTAPRTFVHFPGEGWLDNRGRYYPEPAVTAAVRDLCAWWAGLDDAARDRLLLAAHHAAVDAEIEATVFGEGT